MNENELTRALRSRRSGEKRTWKCPDEMRLASYVDGTLSRWRRRRTERHLADCGFCMEQVAFLVHLEEAELPSDVPSALLARARKVVHEPSPLPRFEWRWAGVAAATAVIVGLVSLTILQIGRDDTAPDQRVRSPQQEAVSPMRATASGKPARKEPACGYPGRSDSPRVRSTS
jgi:anti-sigma factor RsiW